MPESFDRRGRRLRPRDILQPLGVFLGWSLLLETAVGRSLAQESIRPTEAEVGTSVDLVIPGQVDLTSAKIRGATLPGIGGGSALIDCRSVGQPNVLRCSPKVGVETPREGILRSEICVPGEDGSEICRTYVSKKSVMLRQAQLLTIEVLKGPEQNSQLVLSGFGVTAQAARGRVTWETIPPNYLPQPDQMDVFVGPYNNFQAIVPLQCPAAEVTLQRVTLTLPNGRVQWQNVGPIPLCPVPPSPWEVTVHPILVIFLMMVLQANLIFLGWFFFSDVRKRNMQGDASQAPKVVDPSAHLEGILARLDNLGGHVQRIPEEIEKRCVLNRRTPTTEGGTGQPTERHVRDQQSEQVAQQVMLNLVNSWWEKGGRDRKELSQRIQRSGLPLQLYRSVGLDTTLTIVTNRTFGFAPATDSNPAEWLCYVCGDREILALPLDARLFEAGSAMVVVALLFEGLGTEPPAKLSFRRADRACRLTSVSGARDRYSLKEPGLLQVTDRSGQPLKDPPVARPGVFASSPVPEPVATPPDFEKILAPLRALPQRWESLVSQLQPLNAEGSRLQELSTAISNVLNAVEQMRREVHDFASRPGTALRPSEPADPNLAPQLDMVPQIAVPVLKGESVTLRSAGMNFSRELTRQVEPELSETISAEARELRDRLQPLLTSLPITRRGDLRPGMYLERLKEHWEVLSRWQDWAVDLVRFQAATGNRDTDDFLRLEEARIEGPASFRAGGVLFKEDFTIQLALRIRDSHSRCIGLIVAPSAPVDKYRDSFSRLTRARLPDGPAVISAVRSPAILQLEPEHGTDIWRVVLPLQVELV